LIFEFVEMSLPNDFGDGEGTGNTVPPGDKRKNFQVCWINSLYPIQYW